ncbi:MAG: hypothetical protein Q4C09_03005 [Atopobiaceae bacterium]|nr:hypothetical protein [Atopobiaceae bacterium]
MAPLCSASGMNRDGGTKPKAGSFKRTSASPEWKQFSFTQKMSW